MPMLKTVMAWVAHSGGRPLAFVFDVYVVFFRAEGDDVGEVMHSAKQRCDTPPRKRERKGTAETRETDKKKPPPTTAHNNEEEAK